MLRSIREKYLRFIGSMSAEDYRKSDLRVSLLADMVREGERARTIKEFADEVLAQAKDDVLRGMPNPNCDLKELQYRYRAALEFVKKIDEVIALAESKQAKLSDLKKES